MERREAPNLGATPRGRMLPLVRASGVARATERSACANRLLRARGASRRSTANPRRGGRPPPCGNALTLQRDRIRMRPAASEIRRYVTEIVTDVKHRSPIRRPQSDTARSELRSPVSGACSSQMGPLFHRRGDGCEEAVDLGAQALDDGDNGHRDAGRDHCIFNGSSGGIIRQKAQNCAHRRPHSGRFSKAGNPSRRPAQETRFHKLK